MHYIDGKGYKSWLGLAICKFNLQDIIKSTLSTLDIIIVLNDIINLRLLIVHGVLNNNTMDRLIKVRVSLTRFPTI